MTNVYPRSEKNSVTLEQYSGNAYIIEGLTKVRLSLVCSLQMPRADTFSGLCSA